MSPSPSPLQHANTTLKPEEQHVEFLNTSSVDISSDHSEGTFLNDSNQVYIFTGIGIIILCIIIVMIAFIYYNKSQNIQNKPHSIGGKSPVPIDSPEDYDIDIPLQKFSMGSSRLSVPSSEGPKKRLPLVDIYSASNTQNEGTNRIHTNHDNNYDGEAAIVLTVIRSYSEGIYNPLQQIDDEKEMQPMSMWDIQSPDGYNHSVLATIDDIQDGDIIVDIDNMYTTLGYRRSVHNFEDAHQDPVVNGGFSDQEVEYVTPEHDEIVNGDEKEHVHVTDNNNHLSGKVKKQKKRNKKNKQIKGKRIEKRKIILTRRGLAALSKVELVKICKMYKVPINGSKGDIVGRLLDHVYKQKMKKKKKRKK